MINFTRVAQQLRRVLMDNPPARIMPDGTVRAFPESLIARRAVTDTEREMAIQSMEFLFSHLTHFEQFREAAQLLAFAMPHDIRQDPRIKALVVNASLLADQMDTPEKELAYYLKQPAHTMPDWFKDQPLSITKRAQYWLSVVKIARCATAIEWATGCGLNVLHCAALCPDVHWAGVDANENQIAWNQENWKGAPVTWAVHNADWAQRFDCVAVLDTLEHSVHPNAILDQAESWLKEGGLMVLTVPNGPWSLHTPNEELVNGHPGGHVAVGSPETLLQLLEERRASVLDARVIGGDIPAEGNSCLCLTYAPRVK